MFSSRCSYFLGEAENSHAKRSLGEEALGTC